MTDILGNEEWIAEHGRFLRRMARALLADEAQAEDAVQDAWVEALGAAPPRNPGGWLVDVTRRMAARAQRGAARRRGRESVVARHEALPATDTVVAQAEIVRRVATVVSDLPEPFRETLLLRFWEGLPPRDVAARLDVPVDTVRSRTRRGLERVRAELDASRGADPSDWRAPLVALAGPAAVGPAAAPAPLVHVLGVAAMKSKHAVLLLTVLLLATIGVLVVEFGGKGAATEPADAAVVASPIEADAPPAPVLASAASAARSPLAPGSEGVTAATTAEPSFFVRVVDLDDSPIPRAHVLAGGGPDSMRRVGVTDEEGRLAVERTTEPRWVAAGGGTWARSPLFPVPAADGATLTVQLALRGVPLEVRVTREDGGAVASAQVRAGREEEVDYRLPSGATARTAPWALETADEAGVARFIGLRPGWLRVRVDADGFAATTVFTTLELGTTPSIEVTLQSGITVTGRVTDERGSAVIGAVVRRGSGEPSVVTDESGRYRLGPVDPGKVTVFDPSGRSAEARVRGEQGEVVDWSPTLDEAPMLTGRVVDGRGLPQAGWMVRANDDTWPGWRVDATTDDDGGFEVFGDREAALRVEARPSADVDLPHGVVDGVAPGSLDIVVVADAAGSARVRARITRDDGARATDLPLRLRIATRPDRSRLTASPGVRLEPDVRGNVTVDRLPRGRYEIVLVGPPFGWHRLAEFDLDTSEDLDLGVLAAPAPGTLESRSLWGAPEPMGDARYLLERRDVNVTVLSFRGWFPESLRLAPGTYTLQTEVTPGPQRTLEFEILPGGTTSIDIDLRETCEHEIAVRYADGSAPSGAVRVTVRRLDDDSEAARDVVRDIRKDAWRSTIELPAGRFEFVATDPEGRVARAVEPLYTSTPGRRVDLVLPAD